MGSLSDADLWRLETVEKRLVDTGVCPDADSAGALAAMQTSGYLSSPAAGYWTLTEKGWSVCHAFHRHLAANREALQASGVLPPFTEPAPPDERREQRDIAREMFFRALAAAPTADPATVADRAITAAATFISRRKAAAL